MGPKQFSGVARFGVFEANLSLGEIRKGRTRLHLPQQPYRILSYLLLNAGRIVTVEELKQLLWDGGTWVDYEHGLHIAIRRLRVFLGDTAKAPRFIETVHRSGYRLICPVIWVEPPDEEPREARPQLPQTSVKVEGTSPPSRGWIGLAIAPALGLTLLAVIPVISELWLPTAGYCHHGSRANERTISTILPVSDGVMVAYRPPSPGKDWTVQIVNHGSQMIAPHPSGPISYHGAAHIEQLLRFKRGVVSVLFYPGDRRWEIWRDPSGWKVGPDGSSVLLYRGSRRVDHLVPFGDGLLVALFDPATERVAHVIHSPEGSPFDFSTSSTVYKGKNRVEGLAVLDGAVITALYDPSTGAASGVWRSPDGRNLGGGGLTENVYHGLARVQAMVATESGLLTAFWNPRSQKSWGVYISRDGRAVANELAYNGLAHIDRFLPLRGGVVTAFVDPRTGDGLGIYYSPDGLDLAGGGYTKALYRGVGRVSDMVEVAGNLLVSIQNSKDRGDEGVFISADGQTLRPAGGLSGFQRPYDN